MNKSGRPAGRSLTPSIRTYRLEYTLTVSVILLLISVSLRAGDGPRPDQVVEGDVEVHEHETDTTHIHASDDSIIEYESFDIPSDHTVRFEQFSSSARVLNRVTGGNVSNIDGTLSANGQVYLTNPNGVIFGEGARVNTARFVAAAASMSNADFLNHTDRFTDAQGTVENHGTIVAKGVHLIGKQVRNFGEIRASDGIITMASGDTVTLKEGPGDSVYPMIQNEGDTLDGTAVKNEGMLQAKGGDVRLGAGDRFAVAIHNTGKIRTEHFRSRTKGDSLTRMSGSVDVSSGEKTPDREGGTMEIYGQKIAVSDFEGKATGEAGGGVIHIGGGPHGETEYETADYVYLDADTQLNASATGVGHGGEAVVWSDVATYSYGDIAARGGSEGGDGGFVEVSGKYLDTSISSVDVSASEGEYGTILFDPQDIVINGGTLDGDDDDAGIPNNERDTTFSSDDGDTVLNAEDLSGTFDVYESELEGTTSTEGDIVLEATDSITTSGSFTDDSSDGNPDVLFNSDVSITLRTRNDTSQSDTAGDIDLTTGSDGSNLAFETQGTGTITMEAGSANDATSNIVVGNLITASQQISLTSNTGSISIAGNKAIDAGTANVILDAGGGSITQNTGSLVQGSGLVLRGTGPVTLTESNVMDTVAANITGSGNALSYTDTDSFSVGSVDGTSGVSTNGSVNLTSEGDDSTLTVTGGNSVSGSGNSTFIADDMAINDTVNVGSTNTLRLKPESSVDSGDAIALGSPGKADTLELSDAELDMITANPLRIGDANAGDFSFPSSVTLLSSPVDTLSLISGAGTVASQGARIEVENLRVDVDEDVKLGKSNNDVNTLSVNMADPSNTGYNLKYFDTDSFTIGTVDGTSGLTTSTTSSANTILSPGHTSAATVDQTAAITTDKLELKNGNATTFTLTDNGNDANTISATVGNQLDYHDTDDLTIGSTLNQSGFDNGSGTIVKVGLGTDDSQLTVDNSVITSGKTTLVADNMFLNSTIQTNSNILTLRPENDAGDSGVDSNDAIDLGSNSDSTTDTLELSDGELDQVNSSVLRIGDTNTGSISITNSTLDPGNVSTVSLITGSTITQSKPIGVTDLRLDAASSVSLQDSANNIDTLAANIRNSGADLTYLDTNAFTVGTVDTQTGISTNSGAVNLTVDADDDTVGLSNGRLTVGQSISGAEPSTLTADAIDLNASLNFSGTSVTLKPESNNDTGDALRLGSTVLNTDTLELTQTELNNVTANTVRIGDVETGLVTVAESISLSSMSNLSILSDEGVGDNTDTGDISLSGGLRIDVDLAVDLSAGNDVDTLAVNVSSGSDLTFDDTDGLTVGTVDTLSGIDTNGGDFTLTASGNVTDTAPTIISGTADLSVGTGNSLTLDDAGNDFGTVTIGSGNATIEDQNGLTLAATSISDPLTVRVDQDDNASNTLSVSGDVTASSIDLEGSISGNDRVDLSGGVNLTADGGALNIVTGLSGIDLSGASGSNNTIEVTDPGDSNLELASLATTGSTNVNLTVRGTSDIRLRNVDLDGGDLTGELDTDDDEGATGKYVELVNIGTQSLTGNSSTSSADTWKQEDLLFDDILIGDGSTPCGTGDCVITESASVTFTGFIDADNNGTSGTSDHGLTVSTTGGVTFEKPIGQDSDGSASYSGSDPDGLEFLEVNANGDDNVITFDSSSTPVPDVTTTQQVNLTADNMTLDTSITAGTNITLQPETTGDRADTVEVGAADGTDTLGISSTELGNLGAADVIIGTQMDENTLSVSGATGTLSYNLTLRSDSMDISSGVDVGGNRVTLKPETTADASDGIILGANPGNTNTLELDDGELDQITAGTLQIGDTGAGSITLNAGISPDNVSTAVSLLSDEGIADNGDAGDVTFAGGLRLDVDTSVDLSAGNDVDTLAANVADAGEGLTFDDSDDLTIGTVDGTDGVSTNDGAVTITAGTDLTVTNTGATDDVSSGTGSIGLTAGGNNNELAINSSADVDGTGGMTLTGDEMDLQGTVSGGSSTVTLLPNNTGESVDLGSTSTTVDDTLYLSDAELDAITADTLRIGSGTTGAFTVSTSVSPANLSTAFSLLSDEGIGDNTDTGDITFAGGLRLDVDTAVDLSSGNDVDTLAANVADSSQSLTFDDSDGLTIGTVDGTDGVSTNDGAVTITAGTDLTVTNTGATDDVASGTGSIGLTAGGNNNELAINSSADVDGTGGMTLTGDEMDLQGTVSGGSSTVTLLPNNTGESVDLGSTSTTVDDTLYLSDAELDAITADTLRIGSGTTGAFTVSASVSPANLSTAFSLLSDEGIGDNANAGDITFAGGLRLDVDTAVDLSSGNDVNTLAANLADGANLMFDDTSGVEIGTVDTLSGVNTNGGNFTLTTSGNVTDVSPTVVSGTTDISAGAGNTITLDHSSNDFGTVTIGSGSATIEEQNGLTLSSMTTGGSLTVRIDQDDNATNTLNVTGDITASSIDLEGSTAGDDLVDLSGSVTLDATGGALNILTGINRIDLSGAAGTTNTIRVTDSADSNVDIATVQATGSTDVNLTVKSTSDITLRDVDINSGDLVGVLDTDDDEGAKGDFGSLTVGTRNLTGNPDSDGTCFSNASCSSSVDEWGNTFGDILIGNGVTPCATGDCTISESSSITFTGFIDADDNGTSGRSDYGLTISTTGDVTFEKPIGQDRDGSASYSGSDPDGLEFLEVNANGDDKTITFDNSSSPVPDVTTTQQVNFTADNMTLDTSVTAGTNITLQPETTGDTADTVALGAADGTDTLGISSTELGNLGAADVIIGTQMDENTLSVSGATGTLPYNLTLRSDSMDIASSVDVGSNRVTLKPESTADASDGIILGANPGNTNTLELDDGELDQITAGTLQIGDSGAGSITLNASISPGNVSTAVSLLSDEGIADNGDAGDVTFAGGLRIDVDTSVDLSSGNDVDTLAANVADSSQSLTFDDSDGLTIGTVDGTSGLNTTGAGGDVTLTTGGTVTDNAASVIPGTTSMNTAANAASTSDITLDDTGNDFGTISINGGNQVMLRDQNDLSLSGTTPDGVLDVAIDQDDNGSNTLTVSGDVTAGGQITFSGTSGNDSVDLAGGVDITAGSPLSIQSGLDQIRLTGATGTTNVLSNASDGAVTLTDVIATGSSDVDLEVRSTSDITMQDIDINQGSMIGELDTNDNEGATGTINNIQSASSLDLLENKATSASDPWDIQGINNAGSVTGLETPNVATLDPSIDWKQNREGESLEEGEAEEGQLERRDELIGELRRWINKKRNDVEISTQESKGEVITLKLQRLSQSFQDFDILVLNVQGDRDIRELIKRFQREYRRLYPGGMENMSLDKRGQISKRVRETVREELQTLFDLYRKHQKETTSSKSFRNFVNRVKEKRPVANQIVRGLTQILELIDRLPVREGDLQKLKQFILDPIRPKNIDIDTMEKYLK